MINPSVFLDNNTSDNRFFFKDDSKDRFFCPFDRFHKISTDKNDLAWLHPYFSRIDRNSGRLKFLPVSGNTPAQKEE
jgi:hypothetical protein